MKLVAVVVSSGLPLMPILESEGTNVASILYSKCCSKQLMSLVTV